MAFGNLFHRKLGNSIPNPFVPQGIPWKKYTGGLNPLRRDRFKSDETDKTWSKKRMARIYLSSTFADLKQHRQAVYHSLRMMRHDVIAMENYIATDQRPLDKCLADVEAADIYVGLFAWRYGYIPSYNNPSGKSITELEYDHARQVGKPCLIFLLDENAPWPPSAIDRDPQDRIVGFRQKLQQESIVSFFRSPEELANQVIISIVRVLEPPHARLRVFLCHASEDKQTIRDLYGKLMNDGFDPWLDEEKILPGQEWQREITSALHNADVVLVCLSRTSVSKTGYVQKEIKDVLDLADLQPEGTIFLIPVRLDSCSVPQRLSRWQWVDHFQDKGYEFLLKSLHERAGKNKL
jgi:hypothetical protein